MSCAVKDEYRKKVGQHVAWLVNIRVTNVHALKLTSRNLLLRDLLEYFLCYRSILHVNVIISNFVCMPTHDSRTLLMTWKTSASPHLMKSLYMLQHCVMAETQNYITLLHV